MKRGLQTIIGLSVTLTLSAHAQNNSWISPDSGFWDTSNNWSLAKPPATTQSATFITNANTKLVTIDATTVNNFPGTLTISNLTVQGVGVGANNTLRLQNMNNAISPVPLRILKDLLVNSGGRIEINNSTLRVDGTGVNYFRADGGVSLNSGSVIITNRTLVVGALAQARGSFTNSGGTLLARDVWVGEQVGTQGTLAIAGGTTSLSSNLFAGRNAGATGTVWLTGGQLFTTNFPIFIGETGVGRMTVSDGTWQANEVDVGQNNGSQGTLTFAGGTNSLSPNLIAGYNAGANGTVWLTGGQLFTTNSSSYIGFYGVGRVTVSNGTWQAGTVELGFWPGAQGTLTVAGGTTQLSGDLRVSDPAPSAVWVTAGQLVATNGGIWVCNYQAGVGQVTVSNGTLQAGTVRLGCVAGSQGTLTIAGGTNSLSSDLYAGYIDGATGTVWLTGGQLFTTNSSSYIGYSGVGRMTVSNGTWKAGGILVGFASHGTLTFAGGTNSLSSVLYAGCTAGVTGTVWLTGGQLFTMNSSSEIGYSGVGRMTVSNGTWQAGSVYVSLNAGSQGMLTITGGTSSVYNFMQVGRACTAAGTVTVTRGSLYVTNAAHTAYLDLEDGQVTVSGGLLVVDKIIVTNACGRFNYTGGTLQVTSLDLSPALDADADGLPNGWEQAYGLDPLSSVGVNGPGGDPDGDGLSNSEEYQLGTAPRDSSDPYRITSIVREANNIRLIWQTVGGKINVVQVTKGAAGGSYSNNFTDLSATIVPDGRDVTTTNYLDVGGATNFPARYYRIRHD